MDRAVSPRILCGRALAIAIAATPVVTTGLGGCGSRGPLDDTAPLAVPDATVAADVATPSPLPDGSPSDAGGIVACGACLFGTCGSLLEACVGSEGCRAILQCAGTQCADDGGGFDSSCLFRCAGSDPQGALQLLGLVQCVTGECGDRCSAILGGLGGGRRDGG